MVISTSRGGSAFLLAQLGAHAATRFGERVAELDLTLSQTGLLRAVATEPGRSQQALAGRLGMPASRLVALVDGLAERGLLERRRNPDDRRLHALHLTATGEEMYGRIAEAARAHENDLLEGLDDAEREVLQSLLGRIAERQGVTPGVHPGFKRA